MTYVVLVIVQFLFALNTIASKSIVTQVDPLLWSLIRLFIASLFFIGIGVCFFRDKFDLKKNEIFFKIAPVSFIGFVLGQCFCLFGLRYTTSVHASIIITTIPIICLFLNVLFKDEKLTLMRGFAFLVSLLGVYILNTGTSFSIYNDVFLGDLLVFIGAFCVAAQIVLTRKFIIGRSHFWVTTFMFLMGSLGCALLISIFDSFDSLNLIKFEGEWLLWGLYTILGGTIIAHFLNNWTLTKLGSTDVSLFMYMQPLLVGLMSYLLYQSQFDLKMVSSSILVGSGLMLFSLSRAT